MPQRLKQNLKKKLMREWGVDESLHAAFWNSHVKYVRRVMCGVTDPQPAHIPVLLPNDFVEAIREVMTQEFTALVKDKGIIKIWDTLEEEY
jgi:hypothetical protein